MKKKLLLFAILIFNLFFLVKIKYSFAQQNIGLQVAPARQEITVDPGASTAFNVRFYNLSEETIAGIVKVADFIVTGTDGSPRIIDNPLQASPRFAASNWITLPNDQIAIAPHSKVSLQAKINVPNNARPGGRYIAIYFEPSGTLPKPVGGEQEAATVFAHRIASLAYIRVSGPVQENAFISQLYAPSFYEYGPISVEAEIVNRSDIHIRPNGYINLTNMFNAVVDQKKLTEQNIFPDTARSYQSQIGHKWMMGRYKIELIASYGETGKTITRSIFVWVFPWRITVVVILFLILVFIGVRHMYQNLIAKEALVEKELKKEKEEIERLKEQLKERESNK